MCTVDHQPACTLISYSPMIPPTITASLQLFDTRAYWVRNARREYCLLLHNLSLPMWWFVFQILVWWLFIQHPWCKNLSINDILLHHNYMGLTGMQWFSGNCQPCKIMSKTMVPILEAGMDWKLSHCQLYVFVAQWSYLGSALIFLMTELLQTVLVHFYTAKKL